MKKNEVFLDECDKIEKFTFRRKFTEDELLQMKENLSKNSVELSIENDEFNKVKELHKLKTEPLKKQNENLVTNLKNRDEMITCDCGVVLEQELGIAVYYNEGIEVGRRALFPDERQTSIKFQKTSTNN